MQRADGAFGAFIVRKPISEEPHGNLYDFDKSEHVLLLQDWGPEISLAKFIAHHHSDGDNKPNTLLVNGQGSYKIFGDDNLTFSPKARFLVEKVFIYNT